MTVSMNKKIDIEIRHTLMPRIGIILILAALLLATVACSHHDKEPKPDGCQLMKFNCSHPSVTRATETAFEQGDKVGIFVTETSAPLDIAGNVLNNEEVTFNGSAWTPKRNLPWGPGTYNVYAHYPRVDRVTSATDLPFAVCTDQRSDNGGKGYEKSDFLHASALKVSASAEPVNLQFRHIMSKLQIRLIPGDDYEGDFPDNATIYIHSIYNQALVDLEAGTVTKDGRSSTTTIVARRNSNSLFSAIMVPQRMESRQPLVELVMGGVSYMYEAKFVFKPGIQHTVNLVVSKSPEQLKLEIGGEIQNWN